MLLYKAFLDEPISTPAPYSQFQGHFLDNSFGVRLPDLPRGDLIFFEF